MEINKEETKENSKIEKLKKKNLIRLLKKKDMKMQQRLETK